MQFAGQRTNEDLEPVGEPDNILVKLADDCIPEPDAILVHGITPQQTLTDGMGEAEFAAYFHDKVATPDTIFVGFNNIRFDDEFMRFMCYRSFYDPYEWHWKDGKSRWDLLDAFRMMRALRPEGMQWPFSADGKPTVRLEELAKANGVTHDNAHDALSDVLALIDLARKFRSSQPKLFQYLLQARDKKAVAKIVNAGELFVYTSGKYASDFNKTTVVYPLLRHPRREATIVYDVRFNPEVWFGKTAQQLAEHWTVRFGDEKEPLPVKTMQHNRCPVIAPISVLSDKESRMRIGYDETFEKNARLLLEHTNFRETVAEALDIIEQEQQTRLIDMEAGVDSQLYDGFWSEADHAELVKIRMSDPAMFADLATTVKNKRLRELMPLYKARNYPQLLTPDEHEWWQAYKRGLMFKGGTKSPLAKVSSRLQELATTRKLTSKEEYLLGELQLYIESIVPEPEEE